MPEVSENFLSFFGEHSYQNDFGSRNVYFNRDLFIMDSKQIIQKLKLKLKKSNLDFDFDKKEKKKSKNIEKDVKEIKPVNNDNNKNDDKISEKERKKYNKAGIEDIQNEIQEITKKIEQEKKTVVEETVDDKPIVELKEKLEKINEDINVLNNNKNINNDKKSKVQQFLAIFTKKFKERMNIKIDLIDAKGEKVNINSKGDTYANEYLVEKTVYELNSFNLPQKTEEDTKDSKKNTKKDFKKDDKKKENKDKEKEKNT